MYNQHPYLDSYYQGSNMQDRDAALLAREASWALGNDYVSGQLNEAQRYGGIQMHDVAQRLAGEAQYIRDRHMQGFYSPTPPAYTAPPSQSGVESNRIGAAASKLSSDAKLSSSKKSADNFDFDAFYKKYFAKSKVQKSQSLRSFFADDDAKAAMAFIASFIFGTGLLSYFAYWITH